MEWIRGVRLTRRGRCFSPDSVQLVRNKFGSARTETANREPKRPVNVFDMVDIWVRFLWKRNRLIGFGNEHSASRLT